MSKSKIDTIFGDFDTRCDYMWETTTNPVISQYKTVKGSTELVDKEVVSMIKDGWHVHGLSQTFLVSNNIITIQTMVKYDDE